MDIGKDARRAKRHPGSKVMPRENFPLYAFNRGLISPLALSRVDLKRTALSAETMTNWMPRTLGSMMLRPGLEYIDGTLNDAAAVHIPFVFSIDDTAIIELTDEVMRVRVDEEVISRVSVSTAITNGTFDSNVTGWTDADESGATSQWATGGYLSLTGTGVNSAIRTQQVTVSASDQNKEHALNIVIERGPVTIKVGSSSGGSDYIAETELKTGAYSLAFTPTGNFHISLSGIREYAALVDSITVAASGDMQIATPWSEDDLPYVRWDQSADVVFVACEGIQQRRIERHGTRSWGVALYAPEDGPFRPINTGPITITPSTLSGDITLTASENLFNSKHVGALFSIASSGQKVSDIFSSDNDFTNHIRVTGTGGSRAFAVIIGTGAFSATLTLQRSISEPGNWEDVTTYTTTTATNYNDQLDNQIVYYRIGIKTGDYTSGNAAVSLIYSLGSITGIARITGYTSPTSVSAAVLISLGNIIASTDWSEGLWSDYRGWPGAVALDEGRLWWAGKDKIVGSVSDAFDSFDADTEGDSGPISRSIGSGPVDTINWLLPLQRLVVGGQLAEKTARSSSLDEPLTPTNFNLKDSSTRGSSAVPPAKVDKSGLYTRNTRLFELIQGGDVYSDYDSVDITSIAPEVGSSGFKRIAVQRYPDTRIHCVRNDGKVAILVYDRVEEVKCWILVETDGTVEDAFVLPAEENAEEDRVYYLVNRTVDGNTVRYLEKWALESECEGDTLNKQADSFVTFTNSPAAASVPAGTASHLVGETVVVWADGKCLRDADGNIATFTVAADGGIDALTNAGSSYSATTGVVGLAYTARFRSSKLAYAAAMGTALTQRKRVSYLGLILLNTHAQGLKYGTSFDHLDSLPLIKDGAEVDLDDIHESYDMDATEVNDTWGTDSRLCLEANAPRPCTVSAAVITLATHDKG